MRQLKLFFNGGQLSQIEFHNGAPGDVRVCVRGKCAGAYARAGSFQWTSAVRGLSLLLVRACDASQSPTLHGDAGSLAASLDYAISKEPMWLTDMFGYDSDGVCTARRIVLRTNTERKRPGPTVVSLNHRYLRSDCISIFTDGRRCSREDLLELGVTLSGVIQSEDTTSDLANAA